MKVLIADDEQKVCALIHHLVDWNALKMNVVGFAHNGEEALSLIKEHKPDIVITDIRMPGYNGLEVIREAKEINPDIEFIVISGFKQFDYAKEALQYGVSNYLVKPVNQKELLHTLKKIQERCLKNKNQVYKNHRLEEAEKENQRRIRKEVLREIILKNERILPESLNEDYHYHLQKGIFQLAILKFDGIPNIHQKSKHFSNKVEYLLKTYMGECYDWEFILDEGRYIVLLNASCESVSVIKRNLKAILDELLEQQDIFKGFSATMGLSLPHEDHGEIFRCFECAKRALENRLILGTNQIIIGKEEWNHFDSEKTKQFNIDFFQAIEVQDLKLLENSIETLKNKVLTKKDVTGYEILRICKDSFSLYLLMLKKFQFLGEEMNMFSSTFFSELENFGSGSEVFDYLKETIIQTFGDILKKKEELDSRPITEAKKYINQNLSSPLSLEIVSEKVGFSSAYFSSMFKNETGETYSEYLFRKRMDEAKQQLRDTKNSVAVICENVGYNDLKHFTKGFKKHTGLSPKEYRKLYS